MKKILSFVSIIICLAGCQSTTQTTSGQAYLAKHPVTPSGKEEASFEDQLRKAASVEPTLTFPARIGLARIDGGRLIAVPANEADAWIALRDKLGKNFGEFVPLSPLVAHMVESSVVSDRKNIGDVMNEIRLGAARQHLDAVLVYEVYTKTDTNSNILSIADLTIVGGFLLPSKTTEAQGFADAMLIDVMQGYPYGTVSTTVDKEDVVSSRWGWGSDSAKAELNDHIKQEAAIKLSYEVDNMLHKLASELAEKQAK